jgi:Tol biopolymer transport system component
MRSRKGAVAVAQSGLILILALAHLACSSRDSLVISEGYPPAAFGFPSVNPSDSTIAFSYSPLRAVAHIVPGHISKPAGVGYTYEWSDSGTSLMLADWNGSNQRTASRSPALIGGSWSPDGRAFLASGLLSVPWDGSHLDENAATSLSAPFAGEFRWNRTMTKIAATNGQLLIWTPATNAQIYFGDPGWREPSWSPDGASLVFHGYENQQDAVMVSDTLGMNVRVAVGGLTYLGWPAWSPDGSRIAFAGRFTNGGNLEIWTVKPDGTGLTQITTDGVEQHFSWSPSGAEIVYTHYSFFEKDCVGGSYRNGTIWSVNPTTKSRRQLTFLSNLPCR